MRILRLTGSTPRIWGIDLHPRLTVVHGLAPDVAGPVRAAVDAIVRARISGPELAAAGLSGTVLVGDVEIPLEDVAERAAGLVPSSPLLGTDLITPAAVLAAGRQRALDATLADVRATLAEAEAALDGARRAWEEARAARARRLRDGWQDRDAAVGALRAARDRAADAAAAAATPASLPRATGSGGRDDEVVRLAADRVAAARATVAAAAAALAEAEDIRARHSGPPARALEDLEALRAELDQVEREGLGMAPAPEVTEAERRMLAERRAALLAEAAALDVRPTDRVLGALAATESHRGIAAVEAARVAVEWERVRDMVAEADAATPPTPQNGSSPGLGGGSMFSRAEPAPTGPTPAMEAKLRAARDRAAAARRAMAEASGAAPLDPTEVEALEAAHAEVLASWEGSERRIGVGRARRRLEEAQLAEREILARMGFASYTEFMVSGRASGMPSQLDTEEARREQMAAETALVAAEDEMAAALSASAPQPPEPLPAPEPAWDAHAARGRLVETLAALRSRAADLLGEDPGDDVAGALRDRIATDPVSDLRMALDEVGVPLGEVMSRDEVVHRARTWVARQDEAARQQAALSSERLGVEDQLARLDATDGSRSAWEALARRRDELREAVTEAEAIVAAIDTADEREAHDRAELARAQAELADAEAAEVAAARTAATGPATAPAVDLDLAQLEAEARDAQTALDVAVSRLLPAGGRADTDPDGEADLALGRAEARVAVARIEIQSLEQIRRAREAEAGGTEVASAVDADSATWRILSRMASHREVAAAGGPGPAPLLVDEPFAALAGADVARVLDALAGPASAVQVIVLTARPEALDWARRADPAQVGVITAAAAAGFPAS